MFVNVKDDEEENKNIDKEITDHKKIIAAEVIAKKQEEVTSQEGGFWFYFCEILSHVLLWLSGFCFGMAWVLERGRV